MSGYNSSSSSWDSDSSDSDSTQGLTAAVRAFDYSADLYGFDDENGEKCVADFLQDAYFTPSEQQLAIEKMDEKEEEKKENAFQLSSDYVDDEDPTSGYLEEFLKAQSEREKTPSLEKKAEEDVPSLRNYVDEYFPGSEDEDEGEGGALDRELVASAAESTPSAAEVDVSYLEYAAYNAEQNPSAPAAVAPAANSVTYAYEGDDAQAYLAASSACSKRKNRYAEPSGTSSPDPFSLLASATLSSWMIKTAPIKDDAAAVVAQQERARASLNPNSDAEAELRGIAAWRRVKPKLVATSARDWNGEFQQLLRAADSKAKFVALRSLEMDFVYAAESFGRIIISEHGLPAGKRTLQPVALGGIAGGEKYICGGILFKFAVDEHGLYGGDANAMKTVAHELKGLQSFYHTGVDGLCFPLMAYIDYRGWRLVAVSLLPLSKGSLIYGSADAGRTVMKSSEVFNDKMAEAARQLQLKRHMVGPIGAEVPIDACCDIEGHLGKDGNYYLLDFARSAPPHPPDSPGANLFRLFRFEFVRQYGIPLSNDGFSRMGRHNAVQHNQEIRTAHEFLLSHTVPEVAAALEAAFKPQDAFTAQKSPVDDGDLIRRMMHLRGVNLRFLGRVRERMMNDFPRDVILTEAIARVCKNAVRDIWRELSRSQGVPTDEPYRRAIVQFLNTLVGRDRARTPVFWNHFLKVQLEKQYPGILFKHEKLRHMELFDQIEVHRVVFRLLSLISVTLSSGAISEFNDAAARVSRGLIDFAFVQVDVDDMRTRVTHMNLIDFADGMALYFEGIELDDADVDTRQRMLRMSELKLRNFCDTFPGNYPALVRLARVFLHMSTLCQESKLREKYRADAIAIYDAALREHLSPDRRRACFLERARVFRKMKEFDHALQSIKAAGDITLGLSNDPLSAAIQPLEEAITLLNQHLYRSRSCSNELDESIGPTFVLLIHKAADAARSVSCSEQLRAHALATAYLRGGRRLIEFSSVSDASTETSMMQIMDAGSRMLERGLFYEAVFMGANRVECFIDDNDNRSDIQDVIASRPALEKELRKVLLSSERVQRLTLRFRTEESGRIIALGGKHHGAHWSIACCNSPRLALALPLLMLPHVSYHLRQSKQAADARANAGVSDTYLRTGATRNEVLLDLERSLGHIEFASRHAVLGSLDVWQVQNVVTAIGAFRKIRCLVLPPETPTPFSCSLLLSINASSIRTLRLESLAIPSDFWFKVFFDDAGWKFPHLEALGLPLDLVPATLLSKITASAGSLKRLRLLGNAAAAEATFLDCDFGESSGLVDVQLLGLARATFSAPVAGALATETDASPLADASSAAWSEEAVEMLSPERSRFRTLCSLVPNLGFLQLVDCRGLNCGLVDALRLCPNLFALDLMLSDATMDTMRAARDALPQLRCLRRPTRRVDLMWAPDHGTSCPDLIFREINNTATFSLKYHARPVETVADANEPLVVTSASRNNGQMAIQHVASPSFAAKSGIEADRQIMTMQLRPQVPKIVQIASFPPELQRRAGKLFKDVYGAVSAQCSTYPPFTSASMTATGGDVIEVRGFSQPAHMMPNNNLDIRLTLNGIHAFDSVYSFVGTYKLKPRNLKGILSRAVAGDSESLCTFDFADAHFGGHSIQTTLSVSSSRAVCISDIASIFFIIFFRVFHQ